MLMIRTITRVIVRSLALGLIGAPSAYSKRNEKLSLPEMIIALLMLGVLGYIAFWVAFIVSWKSTFG